MKKMRKCIENNIWAGKGFCNFSFCLKSLKIKAKPQIFLKSHYVGRNSCLTTAGHSLQAKPATVINMAF